jgi:hypothetical protein
VAVVQVVVAVAVRRIADPAVRTASVASGVNEEAAAAAVDVAGGVEDHVVLSRSLPTCRLPARVRCRSKRLLQNVQLLHRLRRRQPPQNQENRSGRG